MRHISPYARPNVENLMDNDVKDEGVNDIAGSMK